VVSTEPGRGFQEKLATPRSGVLMMSGTNPSLRVLAILADADHAAFLVSATAARCSAEGVEISVISPNPGHPDVDHAICELVAHIRRWRPDVVITSGPRNGDRIAISQRATAAVMRAPDPRYGHTCTVNGGLSTEADLFDGLRQSPGVLGVAA